MVLLTTTAAGKAERELARGYLSAGVSYAESLPWAAMAVPHLVDEAVVIEDLTSLRGIICAHRRLRDYRCTSAILMLDPAAPMIGRLKKLLMLKLIIGVFKPILGWRGRGSLRGNRSELHAQGVLRHHVHGPMQFMAELDPPQSYTDKDIVFDLRAAPEDAAWATRWLAETGLSGKDLVAVAPGAVRAHKQWPIERFCELVSRLLEHFPGITVVVVGPAKDADLAARLCKIDPLRVLSVVGEASIPRSASLFASMRLLVGNDGGAVHLGDAMGTKVVSIVPGLEYPDSIEPWNNKHLAVRRSTSCAPCYSFTHCPEVHNRCMTELPVSDVFDRCAGVLRSFSTAMRN